MYMYNDAAARYALCTSHTGSTYDGLMVSMRLTSTNPCRTLCKSAGVTLQYYHMTVAHDLCLIRQTVLSWTRIVVGYLAQSSDITLTQTYCGKPFRLSEKRFWLRLKLPEMSCSVLATKPYMSWP